MNWPCRWPEYLTRGLLAFISFMNLGTCLRCLFDDQFLDKKVFITNQLGYGTKIHLMSRLFAVYSLINSTIYVTACVHIFDPSTTALATIAAGIYSAWFLIEATHFRTVRFEQSALFPVIITGLAFLWLIVFFFVWRPHILNPEDYEDEMLSNARRYKVPLYSKKKRRRINESNGSQRLN